MKTLGTIVFAIAFVLGSVGAHANCSHGDINGNGLLDINDVNGLCGSVGTGLYATPAYDTNGNGVLELAEFQAIMDINGYYPADINLDGSVDGQDFVIWNAHKFETGTQYAEGDVTCDSSTDGQDFVLWNSLKFMSHPGADCPDPTCDVPALPVTDIEWAASGTCVELEGAAGLTTCNQAQYDSVLEDIDYTHVVYPWTAAVFDGYNTGGQTYLNSPTTLTCFSDGNAFPAGLFDDLMDTCEYTATAQFLINGTYAIIDFDRGVNVWDLVNDFEAVAKRYNPAAYCELDGMMGGGPTGYHASVPNASNPEWRLWQVRSTANCDLYGCRCDATLELYKNTDNGTYFELSVTNDSTFVPFQGVACEDQRFNF